MLRAEPLTTTLALYPTRIPESEAMSKEEVEAFAAWQGSPQGSCFYRAIAEQVMARLEGLPEWARVLSVGEGHGAVSAHVARQRPEWLVEGVDLCEVSIAAALSRPDLPPNADYSVGSVYELDRRSYDAVFCVSAFHHFGQPSRAIDSMKGALVPGGQLYLLDLRRDASLQAYFRRLEGQLAQGEKVKAGLFRDSVAASHTCQEMSGLLGPRGDASPLRLSRQAQRELSQAWPPGALALIEDLFLEARVVPANE